MRSSSSAAWWVRRLALGALRVGRRCGRGLRMRWPWALAFSALALLVATTSVCWGRSAEKAKNVVLMISDGAGYNAFQVASYYQYGELGKEPYDQFPVHYGCTTYMLNYVDAAGKVIPPSAGGTPAKAVGTRPQLYDPQRIWSDFNACRGDDNYTAFTDSGAAATALYTGKKTTRGRLGVSWDGSQRLDTIAELANGFGKSTGVLTSVPFSHATPGALWAHVAGRDDYVAVARAMIYDSKLDVIMGAGHPWYNDDGRLVYDKQGNVALQGYDYVGGQETWRDIVDGDGATGHVFIESKQDFQRIAAGEALRNGQIPRRLLGIPCVHDTLQYRRHGKGMAAVDPFNDNVPSLPTMTRAALSVLGRNPQGFLLVIEGGAVDWANHDRNAPRMVEEQIDFNLAVEAVVDWVRKNSSWDETLLIVTADHECGMIWGEGTYEDRNHNGVFDPKVDRFNEFRPPQNHGRGELPGVQYGSGGHTNALVPLWAIGTGSRRFEGLVDGVDARAAATWKTSGRYVDNTDVFTVIKAVLGPLPTAPVNQEHRQPVPLLAP